MGAIGIVPLGSGTADGPVALLELLGDEAVVLLLRRAWAGELLVSRWPSVPMRPQRVVNDFPSSVISQNFLEEPSTSSYRAIGAIVVEGYGRPPGMTLKVRRTRSRRSGSSPALSSVESGQRLSPLSKVAIASSARSSASRIAAFS